MSSEIISTFWVETIAFTFEEFVEKVRFSFEVFSLFGKDLKFSERSELSLEAMWVFEKCWSSFEAMRFRFEIVVEMIIWSYFFDVDFFKTIWKSITFFDSFMSRSFSDSSSMNCAFCSISTSSNDVFEIFKIWMTSSILTISKWLKSEIIES